MAELEGDTLEGETLEGITAVLEEDDEDAEDFQLSRPEVQILNECESCSA